MPKPRQRVCLQHGLKLDINKLARQGLLQPGAKAAPFMFRWTNNYTGETVATALITTHLLDYAGWFRIQMGELDQWIDLVSFGGRHEWETQVAYASQFDTPVDRAVIPTNGTFHPSRNGCAGALITSTSITLIATKEFSIGYVCGRRSVF